VTKNELAGPDATGHWLRILREGNPLPKPALISLAEAEKRLGCAPDTLLDQGLSGALALYAPVLHEGLYVWPVTEHGIPHDRLVGNVDGVAPIFEARLNYGDYAMLTPTDIKKIKIEQAVKPRGYICPDWVLHHLGKWEASQHEEHAVPLLNQMKRLADRVAWVPAHPLREGGGVVKTEMLRVDNGDVLRLQAQSGQLVSANVNTDTSGSDLPEDEEGTAPSSENQDTGLFILEQQIRAIESGADALKFNRKAILRGGKKTLLVWCLENHPDLFQSDSKYGDSKFMEAWKEASRQKRVVHQNRDTHARRK
jgi:hypothetical protein